MKWRRLAWVGAGAFAGLALGLAAALWWVYATESGARWVVTRLLDGSGGALSVDEVSGSLRGSVELSGLRYRDGGHEVRIAELGVRLGLSGVLSGSIAIEDLRSSEVRYLELDGERDAAAPPGPATVSLPVRLRLARVSLAGLVAELADGRRIELGRITLSGSASGSTASLQRFETRWQGFFVSIQGRFSWDPGLELDGIVSWSGDAGGRSWLGSAELSGRWPRIAIEQELLEPFAETASGELLLTAAPGASLAIRFPGFGELAIEGGLDPANADWRATVSARGIVPGQVVPGWPGSLDIDGAFVLSLEPEFLLRAETLEATAEIGGSRVELALAGALDAGRNLNIDRLDARLGDNLVSASGSIGEALELSVTAVFGDLDEIGAVADQESLDALGRVTALLSELSGRGFADLDVTGTLAAPRVAGEVRIEDAAFLELPLAMTLDFAAAAPLEQVLAPGGGIPALEIGRFVASLGASDITLRGLLGSAAGNAAGGDSRVDLAIEANLRDLAEVAALTRRDDVQGWIGLDPLPDTLGGAARAVAQVSGTRARPRVAVDATFADLALGLPWPAAGSLEGVVEPFEGGVANLSVAATSEPFAVRAEASGRLAEARWSGTIRTFEIDERLLGLWSLEAPAAATVGPGRIDLGNACLVNAGSRVCAEWRFGGPDDGLHVTADRFALEQLDPLLPATMSLAGSVTLDARYRAFSGSPDGSLGLRGEGVILNVAMSETDTVATVFETVALDAALEGYALSLDAGLTSPTAGRAGIVLMADDIRDRAAGIRGRVDVVWPDLGALSLLSPDIGEVGGTLAVAIDLGGSAETPELAGSATLRQGRVSIPEWDLAVERIEAEATSFDGGTLEFSGSGYVEESEIAIRGETALDPAAGWPTRIALTGERVLVSRRADALVYASPDFEATIRLPRIDVTGSVVIPEAAIAVEQLPPQAVRVSADSVVHGRDQPESIRPIELTADVTVELGDSVRYTGANLSSDLSGTLRLRYESGLSPTAAGTLRLAGNYDAYGQSLDLERGELLFAGPLDDPALDVRAVRRIGTTTVGIDLAGTLLAPVVSIFSEPAMSEANALSYLMFGRPLSSSDDTETVTLESTALALGLQQALPAIQRVGETIGLDELSVQATDVDAGALMAGKYLSPKVYMSYTYGLFNRLGGFLLRYDINDRFSLETRSGDEKSMDLLYSVEKE